LGSVNATINAALASEKQRALGALEEFEKLPKQGPFSKTLTQWWNAWETN
jgi:hypothetical protein